VPDRVGHGHRGLDDQTIDALVRMVAGLQRRARSGQEMAVSDPYDVTSPATDQTSGTGSGSPPAVCTARGLVVYPADTGAEAARFLLGPDCHYRVTLTAGNYRVELDRRGIDFSRDLPRVVAITAGQTTQLDLGIDTGIR
jgi:hypothetical protein